MIDIVFWIIIGALSGWIGYLYAHSDRPSRLRLFVAIGVIGGVLGGVLTRALGVADSMYAINPDSVLSALITSGLFVAIYTVVLAFLGTTSKNS